MITKGKKSYLILVPILFFINLLLILVDLIFINLKPWPYASGGGSNYINLSQSLFWRQYAYHCLYFGLQPIYSLGLIVLSLLAGFYSGKYLTESVVTSADKKYKNAILIVVIGLYLISVILSFAIYSIWKEKITPALVNGPLMWLLLLVLLTYEITLVMTAKKPDWLLVLQIPLAIIYAFLLLILFLSQGCI